MYRRRKIHQWQNTLDESQIRKDFQQRTTVKHRDKSSSPVNFKAESSTHVDTSVIAESCQSDSAPEVKAAERILGEIAFQLDKRILSYVFKGHKRLYGFNLRNIQDKIIQVSTHPLTGKVDEVQRFQLFQRYADLTEELNRLGYNSTLHPSFSEFIINTYGIMKQKPGEYNTETTDYNDPDFLRKFALRINKTDCPGVPAKWSSSEKDDSQEGGKKNKS
ncbi:hypothetical protein LDENG_00186400 [Lucifuga dentata]|nr:hypothetical protein LDENG_00186400 [Lucifuga dentata]